MSELPDPFDEHGELKPECLTNIIVALLLKLGGTVEITWEDLRQTNNTGFFYPSSDTGMVLTMDEPERHVGHC